MHAPLKTALAAALLGLALGASAQNTGTAPATGTASPKSAPRTVDRSDLRFMEHAAQGGLAEVRMGEMAKERAAHAQVKSFGERMVQDHGKANQELKAVASNKGMTLPEAPDRSHQRDVEKLMKLQGAEFDRAYMQHMVDDHRKDVKDFEKAARDAKDPDVKAFAAKTLPTLQDHLRLAQTTWDAVKNAPDPRASTSGTGRRP